MLVREVLRPGREQTGVAVLLVAASALAFALAGSAFALWARSAQHCPHQHFEVAPPSDAAQAPALEAQGRCGEAIYRNNPDGSVTVRFETCPGDSGLRPVATSPAAPPEAVRVYNVY